MLIAVTVMGASHVHASLVIQGMEQCVKVNMTYLLDMQVCTFFESIVSHVHASLHGYSGNGTVCEDLNKSLTISIIHNDMAITTLYMYSDLVCNYFFTVSDIDECSTGTDTCDTNADCSNSDGSFTCSCQSGYSGNGTTCQG